MHLSYRFAPGPIQSLMSRSDITILLADDDDGHAALISRNLSRAGLSNKIQRFTDGQQLLDFLFQRNPDRARRDGISYLLLLDIRMPGMDGLEVLEIIKQDAVLRPMPVYILTTSDDPREVYRCYQSGCSHFLVKPVDYDQFTRTVLALGSLIGLVQVPCLGKNEAEDQAQPS